MESTKENETLIYIIGCPGAGKGTLCSRLASEYNWAHISVGDELRSYVQNKQQDDDVVADCVRSATLVPVERLAQIVGDCMRRLRDQQHSCFILDGFPRCADQISHMQDAIGVPDRVVFLDCPRDIAKQRVLTRNIAGRIDDETIFDQRFTEFERNNPGILGYFEARGKLDKIDTRFETNVSYGLLLEVLRKGLLPLHLFDPKPAKT